MMQRLVVTVFRWLPNWLSKWIVYLCKRKYVIGVVGVVFDAQGRFLLLHHTYRRKHPWRLPGGLKERHELPFETVVRELEEEANILVRPLQVIAVEPSEVTLDVAVICEMVMQRPFIPNHEVDDAMWVDVDDLPFALPKEQVQFLATAKAWLTAGHNKSGGFATLSGAQRKRGQPDQHDRDAAYNQPED